MSIYFSFNHASFEFEGRGEVTTIYCPFIGGEIKKFYLFPLAEMTIYFLDFFGNTIVNSLILYDFFVGLPNCTL